MQVRSVVEEGNFHCMSSWLRHSVQWLILGALVLTPAVTPAVAVNEQSSGLTEPGVRGVALLQTDAAESCAPSTLSSARADLERGEWGSALRTLRGQSANCSGLAEYHSLMGRVLEKGNDLPRAAKELNSAIQIDPNRSSDYFELARILFENGDLGEDRALLVRANRRFPNEVWTYLLLAMVYQKFGSITGAKDVLRRATTRWPDNPEAHVLQGNILGATGEHSDAIAEYEKAVQLNPKLAQAYLFYGIELDKAGQTEKAVSILEKCLSLAPRMPNAHYYLGVAYSKQGRIDEAIKELNSSVRLDPKYALAYFQLGKAYRKIGDKANADECMRKFGELSLEEKSASRERERSFLQGLSRQ